MPAKYLALIGLATASMSDVAFAQHAAMKLDIEAQPLDKALNTWASQTGYQVLIPIERAAQGRTVQAVRGRYTPEGALKVLLASSDLKYEFVNARTVTIRANDAAPAASKSAASEQESGRPLVLAQNRPTEGDSPLSQRTARGTTEQSANRSGIEEVLVTAEKRSERLQDVPVPVTAVGADALVQSNQLRLQDYYPRVPGLSVTPGALHGAPMVTIRGLTTGGYSNPTVGIVVDDVPFGASTGVSLGSEVPDIDPSDLARVEVLRGPQGTLYGASSLGGLIKFVTVDPSTDGWSGRLQAGTSTVHSGNDLGYNARGSVNIPLSSTAAIRASGFTRVDPGYIDDPSLGDHDVNRSRVYGGRVSGLWKATDAFTVKLSALVQKINLDGSPMVYLRPDLDELEHTAVRGTGGYSKDIQAYSATLNGALGRADLTAVAGYDISEISDLVDIPARAAAAQAQFGVAGAGLRDHFRTAKLSQEVRLRVPMGERFEWLIGLFHTHENTNPREQDNFAINPVTGAIVGAFSYAHNPNDFDELAAFTDLTVHFTDRFDVQFGGREARNRQSTWTVTHVPNVPDSYVPRVQTDENAFTYLVTPRFRFSPSLMGYARFASGFRPGGPNPNATLFNLPLAFSPDKTLNYELGLKGDLLDRMVSFDASVYYIDWKDIQLLLGDQRTGKAYSANGSRARSQGVELAIDARPVTGMHASTSVAWNDAVLTERLPATSTTFGASGDRLPYSARISGSLSLDQDFTVTSSLSAFVGTSVNYVGNREGVFVPGTSLRQYFPAYATTDARAGLKNGSWTANLFVSNLTDRRGVLTGGIGTAPNPVYAFNLIQPRTVGVMLVMNF